MQQRGAVADYSAVTIFGWWLGCAVALAAGPLLVGSALGPPTAAALEIGAWLGAIGCAAIGLWRAYRARSRGLAWLRAAVWLALLGHGLGRTLADDPSQWVAARGVPRGLVELHVEEASHPGPRCRVRVRVDAVPLWLDAPPQACPLAQGQRLRVLASRLHRHVTPELPGDPSPRTSAQARGAAALATVDRVWSAGGEPSIYWGFVARQRQAAWEHTRGDPAASFVVAASLGVRSAMAPDDAAALRRAGLGHLVAVSGLHVGIAAWLLLAVSRRFGGTGAIGVVLSWVALLGYVALTGASAPAVRAGIMAIAAGLGGLLGRPHHGPVLLAATSVLMLVGRPAWVLDPGFQLSVVAMASLVRAPAGEGLLRQTWRVSWAILPLSLWHFGHAGLGGVLSNLVAVPVFTLWILPLGLVGWGLLPWIGPVALAPATWGARVVLDVAAIVSRVPAVPLEALVVIALVLGAAALVLRRRADGRLRSRWAWLPPLPVAVAVVIVSLWPARVVAPPGVQWLAAGSPRAPAVVTVVPGSEPAVGCVHEVALRPDRWRTLLSAMGLHALGFAAPPEAPHERALAREASMRGRGAAVLASCPSPPSPERVRALLLACRRRAGTRHAIVVHTPDGPQCFVGGRWEPLPEPAAVDPDALLVDSEPTQGPA